MLVGCVFVLLLLLLGLVKHGFSNSMEVGKVQAKLA